MIYRKHDIPDDLLRYFVRAELGLESTPELYVAGMVRVFREVRRVLRNDGTLWINVGDSYAGSGKGAWSRTDIQKEVYVPLPGGAEASMPKVWPCVKPKDLIGIPWSLATALRAPYYTGDIKAERDRVWLAATIDAEGCMSGFRHERKDDGRIRTGVNVTITNTSELLLDEATRIWPASRHDHMSGERLGTRPVWRWIATNVDRNALLMRELYPYLLVKRKQALLAYNLFELSKVAKRDGQTLEGSVSRDKRDVLVAAISSLNQGESVDVPGWCHEPPSPTEPGWYLRSEIIWHKPNPMPESVTDRPTKSHEQIFLLAKSQKYFYDADAIAESLTDSSVERLSQPTLETQRYGDSDAPEHRTKSGEVCPNLTGKRNKRTVWTVTTQPYSGAHFATFPPKLIEPCILAGTSPQACENCGAPWERVVERGAIVEHPQRANRANDALQFHKDANEYGEAGSLGRMRESTTKGWQPTCECENTGSARCVVLDPFFGAGTTGVVASRLNRDCIGLELNPEYVKIAEQRIHSDSPLFNQPDVA